MKFLLLADHYISLHALMVVGLPLGKTFRVTAKEKKTLIKDLGYQQPGNRKKRRRFLFKKMRYFGQFF